MSRPMNYPDPSDCHASIAEHIYDLRFRLNTPETAKAIRNSYGTIGFFMDCVVHVYDANDWVLTPKERSFIKKVFKVEGEPVIPNQRKQRV